MLSDCCIFCTYHFSVQFTFFKKTLYMSRNRRFITLEQLLIDTPHHSSPFSLLLLPPDSPPPCRSEWSPYPLSSRAERKSCIHQVAVTEILPPFGRLDDKEVAVAFHRPFSSPLSSLPSPLSSSHPPYAAPSTASISSLLLSSSLCRSFNRSPLSPPLILPMPLLQPLPSPPSLELTSFGQNLRFRG